MRLIDERPSTASSGRPRKKRSLNRIGAMADLPDISGRWCSGFASPDLKKALSGSVNGLQEWTLKASTDDLEKALVHIHRHETTLLKIVEEEVEKRRHKEMAMHLKELREPHWTLVPTFWLVIIGCTASIIAALVEVLNREEPVKQPPAVIDAQIAPQKAESPNQKQPQTLEPRPSSVK